MIFVALACAVAIVMALVWPRGEGEPEYQGKKLSKWILLSADDPTRVRAVRAIGTNSLPFLMRWVDYEEPAWKNKAHGWFNKLPSSLKFGFVEQRFIPFGLDDPRGVGMKGFDLLGPRAAPAVPELVRLASNGRRPDTVWRAMACLITTGDAGRPEIEKFLTNANPTIRSCATNELRRIAPEVLQTNGVSER